MSNPARPRCVTHIAPYDVVETPDKTRAGWMRAECRRCGVLIGYRDTTLQPTAQRRKKAVGKADLLPDKESNGDYD